MKITVPELERRFCRRVLLRAGCGIKATKTVLRGMVPAVLLLGPLLFGQPCAQNVPSAPTDSAWRPARAEMPEVASGFGATRAGKARRFMAVTAHPLATETAYQVLAAGGTVLDAAVAVQMVLNVVEPQSSGIGGGGDRLTGR